MTICGIYKPKEKDEPRYYLRLDQFDYKTYVIDVVNENGEHVDLGNLIKIESGRGFSRYKGVSKKFGFALDETNKQLKILDGDDC
jgi:hypothetical protein